MFDYIRRISSKNVPLAGLNREIDFQQFFVHLFPSSPTLLFKVCSNSHHFCLKSEAQVLPYLPSSSRRKSGFSHFPYPFSLEQAYSFCLSRLGLSLLKSTHLNFILTFFRYFEPTFHECSQSFEPSGKLGKTYWFGRAGRFIRFRPSEQEDVNLRWIRFQRKINYDYVHFGGIHYW